jgi:hypothetical protein
MRRKDGKCSACKDSEADPNDVYCRSCRNTKSRLQYAPRRLAPAKDRNACNCGNKNCSGLECERATA